MVKLHLLIVKHLLFTNTHIYENCTLCNTCMYVWYNSTVIFVSVYVEIEILHGVQYIFAQQISVEEQFFYFFSFSFFFLLQSFFFFCQHQHYYSVFIMQNGGLFGHFGSFVIFKWRFVLKHVWTCLDFIQTSTDACLVCTETSERSTI